MDDVFDDAKSKWAYCSPCEAEAPAKTGSVCYKPDDTCEPQFDALGRLYHGCAEEENKPAWCSMSRSAVLFGPNKTNRKACRQVDCGQCWVRDTACVESFLYQGATVKGCVTAGSEHPWCSTSRYFTDGDDQWTFCSPCHGNHHISLKITEDCHKPHKDCVAHWSAGGRQYSGCTDKDANGYHWCSLDPDFDKHNRWEKCTRTECSNCFLKDNDCPSAWNLGMDKVDGCSITPGTQAAWCSHDSVFNAHSSEKSDCARCVDESPKEVASSTRWCSMIDPECVPIFDYLGHTFHGCTSMNAQFFWCSTKRLYDGGFKRCTDMPCDQCYIPASGCEMTFQYAGNTYHGCTKDDADMAWCSKDAKYLAGSGRHLPCTPCEVAEAKEKARRLDGISACEGHGFGEAACSAVGCCVWSGGTCLSAVGSDLCSRARCWVPPSANACEPKFQYKGKIVTGCVANDNGQHFCSKTMNYDLSQQFEMCISVDCPKSTATGQCFEPAPECEVEFTYRGELIRGCTRRDSSFFWCSHSKIATAISGFSRCEERPCGDCWLRSPTCTRSFLFRGTTHTRCISDGSLKPWCSKDSVFNDDSSAWSQCLPCEPWEPYKQTRRCYEPSERCVPQFRLNGLMYSGCLSSGGHAAPWCAFEREITRTNIIPGVQMSGVDECIEKPCSDCWVRDPECAPRWKYSVCMDLPGYRDAYGYKCKEWKGFSCLNWNSQKEYKVLMYTEQQLKELAESCPDSCGLCNTSAQKEYVGCTNEHSPSGDGRYWCSTSSTYTPQESNSGGGFWRYCDPCSEVEEFTGKPSVETCWDVPAGCKQPFRLDGVLVTGCQLDAKENWGWCSNRYDFVSLDVPEGSWQWCKPMPCTNRCWAPTKSCVAPFEIKGDKTVPNCAVTGDQAWCSTKKIYDPDEGDNWEFCEQIPCDDMCYLAPSSCVQPFTYRGKLRTGCISENGEAPWCSEVPFFEDGSTAWSYCRTTRCDNVCWLPPPDCKQPFEYKDKVVTGCVRPPGLNGTANEAPWCSKVATLAGDEDPGPTKSLCSQVSCNQMCWQRAPECKTYFKYKGRYIQGCVTDPVILQGASPWCSSTPIFEHGSDEWNFCTPLHCDEAPCEGPQCQGFGLFMYSSGECWQTEGNGSNVNIVVGQMCHFPNYDDDALMLRETILANSKFFALQDYRSRCVSIEGDGMNASAKLVLVEDCHDMRESLKFRKEAKVERDQLQMLLIHSSGRIVGKSDGAGQAMLELKGRNIVLKELREEVKYTPYFDLLHTEPQRCLWEEWTKWKECSVTCGVGARVRTRGTIIPAVPGGIPCKGGPMESIACDRQPCESDCVLGDWLPWGPCRKSCGGGVRVRVRAIRTHASPTSPPCQPTEESEKCNAHPCPVPCEWSEWGDWGACSASCAGGERKQLKRVVQFAAFGAEPCGDPPEIVETCNGMPCPVHCSLGMWGDWGSCSASCGDNGYELRLRVKEVEEEYGGKECHAIPSLSRRCNTHPCPVDCWFDPWQDWTACSLTCGKGKRYRRRDPNQNEFGGFACYHEDGTEGQDCNDFPCPQDCIWDIWSAFTECSQSCGTGTRYRSRGKTQIMMHGGRKCEGDDMQTRKCNTHSCPMDCDFGDWGPWTYCPVTCDGAKVHREREILAYPKHGGMVCRGETKQYAPCGNVPCPVNCIYSTWTAWSLCTLSCGGGVQERQRFQNVKAEHGGQACLGPPKVARPCYVKPCPVNCVLDMWTTWSTCTQTCDVGTTYRLRNVQVASENGGIECQGPLKEMARCSVFNCPVHCEWNSWNSWTSCSKTCNKGKRVRYRTKKMEAQFDGKECEGEHAEEPFCHEEPCPVDCKWFQWQSWHGCSASCGGGQKLRYRDNSGQAMYGGSACIGDNRNTEKCNTDPCPVDCEWTDWGEWGPCSASCGGGERARQRKKKAHSRHGGAKCLGNNRALEWCGTNPCKEAFAKLVAAHANDSLLADVDNASLLLSERLDEDLVSSEMKRRALAEELAPATETESQQSSTWFLIAATTLLLVICVGACAVRRAREAAALEESKL
eukprot:TRINITY_DN2914_c0_g2_i3.p1 TRINITY_DN2914_c0_g2~~TRINITY_DN2914_c0_g2_i3.p1  ORF type:complete len:2033 (+),score=334.18 TRINITY_DN2914_c0_g2_i3:329-6427(+)